jgi:hypothetical protein
VTRTGTILNDPDYRETQRPEGVFGPKGSGLKRPGHARRRPPRVPTDPDLHVDASGSSSYFATPLRRPWTHPGSGTPQRRGPVGRGAVIRPGEVYMADLDQAGPHPAIIVSCLGSLWRDHHADVADRPRLNRWPKAAWITPLTEAPVAVAVMTIVTISQPSRAKLLQEKHIRRCVKLCRLVIRHALSYCRKST